MLVVFPIHCYWLVLCLFAIVSGNIGIQNQIQHCKSYCFHNYETLVLNSHHFVLSAEVRSNPSSICFCPALSFLTFGNIFCPRCEIKMHCQQGLLLLWYIWNQRELVTETKQRTLNLSGTLLLASIECGVCSSLERTVPTKVKPSVRRFHPSARGIEVKKIVCAVPFLPLLSHGSTSCLSTRAPSPTSLCWPGCLPDKHCLSMGNRSVNNSTTKLQ